MITFVLRSLDLHVSALVLHLNVCTHMGYVTCSDSSAVFYGVTPRLSFYLVAIANASSSIGNSSRRNTDMALKVV